MATPKFSIACLNPSPFGPDNLLFYKCCGVINCTVTNIHTTALDVSAIKLGWASGVGGPFDSTGISINGVTPFGSNLPLNVPVGGSFTIQIEICHVGGSPLDTDEFIFGIDTIQHTAEDYLFPFAVINNLSPYINPNTIVDFGSVPFPGTGTATFDITNPTIGELSYQIQFDCLELFNVTVVGSNPVIVAGNTTETVTLEWTPNSLGEILECGIRVVLQCNGIDHKLTLNGTSVQNCDCLCCNQVEIQTENDLLRAINGFCGTNELWDRSAVCEQKTIVFAYSYTNGLTDGVQIWFNPWLWSFWCDFPSKYPSGSIDGPPPVGWFITFNNATTPIGGGQFNMSLIGAGANTLAAKNFNVTFEPTSSTDFRIRFTFFMIEDLEDWTTANLVPNNPKWRRSDVGSINPPIGGSLLDNMIPSVYNMPKKLCSLFYIRDTNVLVDDQPFECFEEHSISWTGRWYNSGLYGQPAEFTNNAFALERGGVPVTTLSTVSPTKIYFGINIDSAMYTGLNGVVFQVFDETQTNNAVDILTNYNSSRSQITTIPGTTILNNDLESPSAVIPLGGGNYQISAHIGTGINPSGVYRVAAIVYAADLETVNTFISDPFTVTQTPDLNCDGCGIAAKTSEFQQYFQSNETRCVQPVAKERINHHLTIDNGGIKDCISDWGATGSWSWYDFLTNITLNVYRRVEDFPNPGQTTFFIWQTHQSNRIVGFPNNWQNLGDMIVADDGSLIDINFATRVRWESTPFDGTSIMTANTATYMNRTSAGPMGPIYVGTLGITNDWRDEEIFMEYKFRFDFSSLFGQPYIQNQILAFKIQPIQNEFDNSGFSSVLTDMWIEGLNPSSGSWETIDGPICPSDWDGIRVKYSANQNGDFILFMNPLGGGIPQLSESEFNDSPFGFPTLNNTISIDPDFSNGGVATAELNPALLTNGSWELCGLISIPPAVLVCQYFQQVNCQSGSGALGCSLGVPPLFNLVAVNATNSRYRFVTFGDPVLGPPIQGQTYVMEYNLTGGSAPTKEIHFWAGVDGGFFVPGSRPSDGFIPIGSTSGTITFVWGGSVTGYVYFQLKSNANPNWTGTMEIKIGNTACP